VALANGEVLNAKICTDLGASANCPGSDAIALSIRSGSVPEPGTFLLLGSGLIGSGALGRRLFRRT
jgi:hypothetical protein